MEALEKVMIEIFRKRLSKYIVHGEEVIEDEFKEIASELTALFEEQRREELIKFYMFNYNNSFHPNFSVGEIVDEYLKSLKP